MRGNGYGFYSYLIFKHLHIILILYPAESTKKVHIPLGIKNCTWQRKEKHHPHADFCILLIFNELKNILILYPAESAKKVHIPLAIARYILVK
jgi:hypothetical protein